MPFTSDNAFVAMYEKNARVARHHRIVARKVLQVMILSVLQQTAKNAVMSMHPLYNEVRESLTENTALTWETFEEAIEDLEKEKIIHQGWAANMGGFVVLNKMGVDFMYPIQKCLE